MLLPEKSYLNAAGTAAVRSVDHICLDNFENRLQKASFRMDIQVDGLGQIQAEDTHDRLGVDHISSGYEIKVTVKFADLIYKCLHFIDRVQ